MMLRRVAALIEAATRHGGVLGQASLYHLNTGGRMWRAKLAIACAGELGVADTGALALAAACELVHQASVVHDDVQDQAPLRRGQMSVAARFGAPVAICVGDHLLMAAFRTLAEDPDGAALIRLFTSRVSDMAAGQAEGFSPTLWSKMTRARYVSLVEAKAGAMIALPVEAAAMLGGLGADDIRRAGRFACAIGVAYQITDDVADVAPDLARGELNGVLVHAVCCGDPVRGKSLRFALTRAAEKGMATEDEATLMAWLRPATEATMRWRDRLLAEAMKEMAGHPLRRILLNAATALAPSPQTPAMGSQHAA
ncbi:MAG: polyprenyl synthetase family protein [Rubritepida sp.]|nr:polyprenyl synthetase family protein [Rubritepida sp.]